ncbi:chorismate mutase [Helcobacillus sp. ACRRO]|uniref:Chorismate mutase n=2 Tax=Helcobacillus massiliensis TaxID=521392 RepID=A0A839QSG8_9MICO|nr:MULTISPECIES: chorismate mutase [Helcobacillus]MBB3023443.1 chorismate mutase [Helcobacillus massiliensis]MCG7427382.1 chorismate mutase [Helcobacillus sp. ACRRO]MDK7743170.1 chorismate mutase [Helcobacillus massiliensis]WOO93243.1 chorismate mutase [Helcobacillus massiliensis]
MNAMTDSGPAADDAARAQELLRRHRQTIDNVDAALVHLLAERFKCTQAVGRLKAENDLPPADPAREARQVERLRALADESGLDPVFAERFLRFIVREVIRHHEQIADEERPSA